MRYSIYDKWFLAFLKKLKQSERGTQAQIAKRANITPKYLSDITKGRRKASQELQEKLSLALGYSFGELMTMGDSLIEKEVEPFPDYDKIMRLPLKERVWAIVRKAAEKYEVTGFMSAFGDERLRNKHPWVQDYSTGKINEEDIYNFASEFFRERVELIIQKELEIRSAKE
ncbi:MAG: helix-turn-helix transcriptional regulator [Desulfobacterales bacterium]|nr:helix-turn-helix transcriptional regulator [Desulfobacterales bacterium]